MVTRRSLVVLLSQLPFLSLSSLLLSCYIFPNIIIYNFIIIIIISIIIRVSIVSFLLPISEGSLGQRRFTILFRPRDSEDLRFRTCGCFWEPRRVKCLSTQEYSEDPAATFDAEGPKSTSHFLSEQTARSGNRSIAEIAHLKHELQGPLTPNPH